MALQYMKPLYGLSDSGGILYKTLDVHKKGDVRIIPAKLDPVFYLFFDSSELLTGMNGSYADDVYRAGYSKLKNLCEITH